MKTAMGINKNREFAKKALGLTSNGWKSDDTRPKNGAWAPGSYIRRCLICNWNFIGDKMACNCADCAYSMPEPIKLNNELDFQT